MTGSALTHPAVIQSNDEIKNMYLNFQIGNEIYGIEVPCVLQIVGMREITEMPEMPSYMKGFINLRSTVIPVVSMRLCFGKTEEAYTDRSCIVIVQIGDKQIGLIVDAIRETTKIDPKCISPPPTVDDQPDCSYVTGIAQLPGGRTSILVSVHKLFNGLYVRR